MDFSFREIGGKQKDSLLKTGERAHLYWKTISQPIEALSK